MKKIMTCVLFLALGLPFSANTSWAQAKTHPNSAKTRKAYLKHEKKQQKKAQRAQKKAQKKFKKQHQTRD